MRIWLAILSGLILGIGFGVVQWDSTRHGANGDALGLHLFRLQSSTIASALHSYKGQHGSYPTNDQGLWPISDALTHKVENDKKGWLSRCRITHSGVLSWWGDPIIYENRKDLPDDAFAESAVSVDIPSKHCLKVDNGIYLWSIGAKQAERRYAAKNRWHSLVSLVTLPASIILLIAFTLRALHTKREDCWYAQTFRATYITLAGLLIMILTAIIPLGLMNGCGCPGRQITRTPELTRSYTAVMRSYRDAGIIENATFQKLLQSLKEDKKGRSYYHY